MRIASTRNFSVAFKTVALAEESSPTFCVVLSLYKIYVYILK